MKRGILWIAGGLGVLVLASFFIAPPRAAPPELCGAGQRLVDQAGATPEEARKLACDHDAAQEGYDALYAAEHGK